MCQRIAAALCALLLTASCSALGMKKFTQPTPAMEPTIKQGQTVTAKPVDDGGYQPVRGDVVVFRAPADWELTGGDEAIKRVIAVGGETIAAGADGRVTVNGAPLDEPYVKDSLAVDGDLQVTVVPEGEIFVLGDNRAQSADSSIHGPVPASAVTAVVELP